MTPKIPRLLMIALSLWVAAESHSRGAEPANMVADNWVPLPMESREPALVFEEPIPVETAFPTADAVPPLPAEPLQPELQVPPVTIERDEAEEIPFGRPYNAPGWYSRPDWSQMNWRSGAGGRFGEFSWEGVSAHPFRSWEGLSFTSGHGFHWLDGPSATDMPPRLFDFHWGLHYFGEVHDAAWIDMGFSVGIYTDFEDSAREGWRIPAHAVFSWEIVPELQPVVGVKYYDRDNLGLLPVAGVIWRPEETFRAELVFPEPKIATMVYDGVEQDQWLSLSGRIGGGQWAIEREPSGLADVVAYNDYQLVLGLESIDDTHQIHSLEIGYSFNQELEYRTGVGNFKPSETIFVRLVSTR